VVEKYRTTEQDDLRMNLREPDEQDAVDVETLWTEESERRLDAYLNGELEVIDGDEAMTKLRHSLR
jgi:hypothetical protein